MTAQIAPRTIDVFRPGTFKPMVGDAVTFSADDLKALAEAYDVNAPAPAVVGHPKTDDPAFAWAKSFAFDEDRQVLTAQIDEIEPAFAEAVQAGRYRKVSLELFTPGSPNNPKPGVYYPKHIGFLGAAAPAVSGLKPVAFAEGGEGVISFCGDLAEVPALKDVASLFRSLREFFIQQFGIDAADKALPNWSINWINDQADPEKPLPFSEPEKPTMTKTPEAIATETELAALKAELAETKRTARHAENLSFAEGLISEGKLLPVLKDKAVALLDELGADDAKTVSFAEGDATKTIHPAQLVKDILSAQPKTVSFAEVAGKGGPEVGAVSFAAPAGVEVDREGLEDLARAQELMAKTPGLSLIDAVKQLNR